MRFHFVSLPHTQTTEQYAACAFTEKVRKACIMMHQIKGHEVFLYSGEFNDAPCTEHIVCISEEERKAAVGDRHYSQASWDYNLPHWRMFNARAAEAIRQRAQPQDFICVIGGLAHKQIADALPNMMTVEFGIGYGGTFSPYRVFESYAWMHTCYGAASRNDPCSVDGRFFDAVIPGYFEVEKFAFKYDLYKPRVELTGPTGAHGPIGYYIYETEAEVRAAQADHLKTCNQCRAGAGLPPYVDERKPLPDDYFLFVGRMTGRKGVGIAEEACKRAGVKLILAGPPNEYKPTYGEWIGEIGPAKRNELMAGAKALFVPTTYIEPFGNVAVEAQACGTPVICTDFGAMTETVEHGKTGFRCHTLAEFMQAMKDVDKLDPHYIRRRAIDNYSLPVIADKYETHFSRLAQLWGAGWYEGAEAA